jgi:hypothetical protein
MMGGVSLSRRSLLGAAAATALLGATGCTQSGIPRPSVSPTGAIRDQLNQAMTAIANGNKEFGVFVEDLRTGGTWSFNDGYTSQSASMAKPMIVSMALRKARPADLDADQISEAVLAITQSNNDAATALWTYAGPSGYTELAKALGMSHTHLDEAKSDQWSWTWTTPADQVKLVKALQEKESDALSFAEAKFVYDQMGDVIADQTWGVGQPKSDSVDVNLKVEVHLKNGWVQFKSTDNLWAVNSMGSVKGRGRDYRMCVMTRLPDFPTGRDTVSEVGKWVFDILGSGTL